MRKFAYTAILFGILSSISCASSGKEPVGPIFLMILGVILLFRLKRKEEIATEYLKEKSSNICDILLEINNEDKNNIE